MAIFWRLLVVCLLLVCVTEGLKITSSVCSQPKKVGPCRARKLRYFFDSDSQQCEQFYYGGCRGNSNRFKDLKTCEAKCGTSVCSQPKKVGPCRARKLRYFFDNDSQQCEQFYYGGCRGNKNRFIDLKTCEAKCGTSVCSQSKKVGPCRARKLRYFFDNDSQQCEKFYYGGCRGNKNRFKDLKTCEAKCGNTDICSLPKKVGHCRALVPSYYFNKKAGECRQFDYGGCGGNMNNFRSLYECQSRCP